MKTNFFDNQVSIRLQNYSNHSYYLGRTLNLLIFGYWMPWPDFIYVVLLTSWEKNLRFFSGSTFCCLESIKTYFSSLFCLSEGLGTYPGSLVHYFIKPVSDIQSQSGLTDTMVMSSLSWLPVGKIGLLSEMMTKSQTKSCQGLTASSSLANPIILCLHPRPMGYIFPSVSPPALETAPAAPVIGIFIHNNSSDGRSQRPVHPGQWITYGSSGWLKL